MLLKYRAAGPVPVLFVVRYEKFFLQNKGAEPVYFVQLRLQPVENFDSDSGSTISTNCFVQKSTVFMI
jgi:hypothetical protein